MTAQPHRGACESDRGEEALAVLTRYPEPGSVKTRLIPVLGAEGAAALQRAMTLRTLSAARSLRARRGARVDVWFAGGTEALMRKTFGRGLAYRRQPQGDLGSRLHAALSRPLDEGARAVVAVGCDCPALDAGRMGEAFDALRAAQVVLGPAADGGYYLIGVRADAAPAVVSAALEATDWGTSSVLERTLAALAAGGIEPAVLGVLADVDVPADLAEWERVESARSRRDPAS